MKKTLLGIVAVVAVGVLFFVSRSDDAMDSVATTTSTPFPPTPSATVDASQSSTPQPNGDGGVVQTPVATPTLQPTPSTPHSVTVRYTNDGYMPETITVPRGTRVTFKNESDFSLWTASNIHPTHTVYPGSGINKCNTTQKAGIFDTCTSITKGQSWSFTFLETGEWRYHNHVSARDGGVVVVGQ
jgi:plastocyanin